MNSFLMEPPYKDRPSVYNHQEPAFRTISGRQVFYWNRNVPTNGLNRLSMHIHRRTSHIYIPTVMITITLAWKPVPGSAGYLVERQYYYNGVWTAYPKVTVSGVLSTSYTFSFVGAQPGRWRVTALGTSVFSSSAPSAWWTFTYKT
jgi:hypothetical protein